MVNKRIINYVEMYSTNYVGYPMLLVKHKYHKLVGSVSVVIDEKLTICVTYIYAASQSYGRVR